MSEIVLDCSITMGWCFEDEISDIGERVLDLLGSEAGEHRAWVPPIWLLEVANVLLVAERRRRLTPADAARFVDLLRSLPIVVEPQIPVVNLSMLAAGRQHQLSAYDACYLQLAQQRGLPLATTDKSMQKTARKAEVALYGGG